MFIPGLELLLHIDLHREQQRQGRRRNPRPETRRATDTHSRTRTHSDARILARPPTGSRGRPASRRGAEKPHHLTAGAAAAASAGNAILPPRAQTGSPGRPPRERPGRGETPEAGRRPGGRGQGRAPSAGKGTFHALRKKSPQLSPLWKRAINQIFFLEETKYLVPQL